MERNIDKEDIYLIIGMSIKQIADLDKFGHASASLIE